MGSLGDGVKKVLLAGIGTAAVTAEKSKEVLDKMAERGEAAVEQGKVLNQELRHNIKKTVKENVNVSVKTSSPEELDELLDKMTPEQIEQLKERIYEREAAVSEEETEKVEEAVEQAGETAETVETWRRSLQCRNGRRAVLPVFHLDFPHDWKRRPYRHLTEMPQDPRRCI